MNDAFYSTFQSQFGLYTIVWEESNSEVKIQRFFLSDPEIDSEKKAFNSFGRMKLGTAPLISLLNEKISKFLEGEDVKFQLDLLDFSKCHNFQKQVLLAEFEIPRGYISTYKRIAVHLGNPNAVRAVGNALARNPFPIVIPCHRAIKSNGDLGGFQGGTSMKRALLKMEGVKFSDSGKVVTKKFFY